MKPSEGNPPPPNVPDWEPLRLFLCVAELGSLSKAAEHLGLSQPTLTRHMAALESSLRLVLFERTARGMNLTEVARTLVEPIRAMRDQSQTVARLAQGRESDLRGTVRLSVSEMAAVYLLPPMLAELRLQSPEIDLVLLATDRVSNLVEREADIAIRNVRPEHPGLVARKVADMPVGAYASLGYVARRGEPQQLQDLLDHDLVAIEQGDVLREGLSRAGLDPARLRFAVMSNSRVVAWELVKAGAGIGFLPVCIGSAEPDLRRVLVQAATPVLPVWLTVHQEVRDSPRLRRVYDFLAERFSVLGQDQARNF